MAKKTNGFLPSSTFWKIITIGAVLTFGSYTYSWVHQSLDGHPVMDERVGTMQKDVAAIKKGVADNHDALIRIEGKLP
jgi:hypothetical protein